MGTQGVLSESYPTWQGLDGFQKKFEFEGLNSSDCPTDMYESN